MRSSSRQTPFLGVEVDSPLYEPLRVLVKLIGRTAVRRIVIQFETTNPRTQEQLLAWLQAAHQSRVVQVALAAWVRAKLSNIPPDAA